MKFYEAIAASVLGFACVTSLSAQSHSLPPDPVTTPDTLILEAQRKPAPDFTLTSASGHPLTLSAYKGKVILLDFWATWCGGCKLERPWYIEFDGRYRHRGLAVVGISMDDGGTAVVKPFLTQQHIRYPVIIGSEGLANQYHLTSMPMTLLIDRQGRIALSHSGVINRTDFEAHIRDLLGVGHLRNKAASAN